MSMKVEENKGEEGTRTKKETLTMNEITKCMIWSFGVGLQLELYE
jgi:hypothetical protein